MLSRLWSVLARITDSAAALAQAIDGLTATVIECNTNAREALGLSGPTPGQDAPEARNGHAGRRKAPVS